MNFNEFKTPSCNVNIYALRSGTILFCEGNRLTSPVIKKVTKSDVTHTANVIWMWGQPYVIDSQRDGTNPRPWGEWVKKYGYNVMAMSPPDFDEVKEKEWCMKAMTKSGHTGYDFVSFVLRHPIQAITGKWEEKGDPYEKMVCSEFSLWTYGVETAFRATPKYAFEYCLSHGFNYIDCRVDKTK